MNNVGILKIMNSDIVPAKGSEIDESMDTVPQG